MVMKTNTKWDDLRPGTRRLILGSGLGDVALRLIAIRDLVGRDTDQVRGPKLVWGIALGVVSSGGILPLVYFTAGRRKVTERPRSGRPELA